jgi:isocitrate lyase
MTDTIEEKAKQLCERLSCHEIQGDEAACIQEEWDNDPRWKGIKRPYSPEDVLKLRGTLKIEHTFAEVGAQRLWHLLQTEDYIPALGAMTGNQAVQQVEAGLKAIYLSGWQVAADANLAGETTVSPPWSGALTRLCSVRIRSRFWTGANGDRTGLPPLWRMPKPVLAGR